MFQSSVVSGLEIVYSVTALILWNWVMVFGDLDWLVNKTGTHGLQMYDSILMALIYLSALWPRKMKMDSSWKYCCAKMDRQTNKWTLTFLELLSEPKSWLRATLWELVSKLDWGSIGSNPKSGIGPPFKKNKEFQNDRNTITCDNVNVWNCRYYINPFMPVV